MTIAERYKHLRQEIPETVTVIVAAKKRTLQEILEVIEAGAAHIGENYVQEAEIMHGTLRKTAPDIQWHMIGHLQTNKISKALQIFDVIETVDSFTKAEAIDKRVVQADKQIIPVFIEINIGSEDSKAGIRVDEHEPFEDYMENLIKDISGFDHLRVEGLMTMGPRSGNPEKVRPYFSRIKKIFDRIRSSSIPNVNMKYLSMGMSNSYNVAIDEGSNMVRIGTAIFGARPYHE